MTLELNYKLLSFRILHLGLSSPGLLRIHLNFFSLIGIIFCLCNSKVLLWFHTAYEELSEGGHCQFKVVVWSTFGSFGLSQSQWKWWHWKYRSTFCLFASNSIFQSFHKCKTNFAVNIRTICAFHFVATGQRERLGKNSGWWF